MTTVRPVELEGAAPVLALPEDVLARFRKVVGPEHVLTGDQLSGHADPYSFLEDAVPAAPAVLPASVEQVQAIVLLAGECQVSLWTVSRGRNYAYGGAAPRVGGSVVLDLQRMDRVLEVDEELGYVVVEPGVSFLDLYAHLTALGSRLLISVPDLGWGSVIGNALERGFGYAAHGKHSANICGLEVVLADGTVLAWIHRPAWVRGRVVTMECPSAAGESILSRDQFTAPEGHPLDASLSRLVDRFR